jgi:hypothetical protein
VAGAGEGRAAEVAGTGAGGAVGAGQGWPGNLLLPVLTQSRVGERIKGRGRGGGGVGMKVGPTL